MSAYSRPAGTNIERLLLTLKKTGKEICLLFADGCKTILSWVKSILAFQVAAIERVTDKWVPVIGDTLKQRIRVRF